ncbi:MAG: DNA polymerase III subunit beta [Candidatus Gracilibacteria bacterium]|nr:DNA polymerase III subunit beta [Candidatus Gracilibacteria bacterium]MDD3120642.1 DNA polymerase III subunit beta [Candidatus Gracilibacteria bacterium]
MQLIVNTDNFREGIGVVSHASSPSSMTPILENILINATYNKLILSANNLEMAIEYVIDEGVEIKKEGSFTLSSKFLNSFLSLLPDSKIDMELVGNSSIIFRTETSETKFAGIEAVKFPVIPSFKKDYSFKVPSKDLKTAIEKTIFSTAEGNIRPTLAGIYIALKDGNIAFASTDSFRLSEFKIVGAAKKEDNLSIILPSKTAIELSRIIPETGDIECFVSENQFIAVFGNIKLFSRLLNGHFPDYQTFFPKSHSTKGIVLRSELIQSLKRINLISKENNYNTRFKFSIEEGLEISTGDTEVGAGRVILQASVEGEENIIGINSNYLLEVLNVIKEEYIDIDFESALSPVVVKAYLQKEDSRNQYKHIIMPLKI